MENPEGWYVLKDGMDPPPYIEEGILYTKFVYITPDIYPRCYTVFSDDFDMITESISDEVFDHYELTSIIDHWELEKIQTMLFGE